MAVGLALALGLPGMAPAQATNADASRATPQPRVEHAEPGSLDSLVARAMAVNPIVRAAEARLDAARARIAPAGLRPDPMLMLGVQNLPVSDPGFSGEMTMKMVGVGQMIPYPGKLSLNRRIAEREADAARAAVDAGRRSVARDVRSAYYELAFLDQGLAIAERNRELLIGLIEVTEARYGTGTGGQQDVLKARVEAGRLAETAVDLIERRRATLARLNAALDRPGDAPIEQPEIPRHIVRAAVAESPGAVRFASSAFGARAADSPLPTVEELQAVALRQSPMLREAEAMVAAHAARAELARRAVLPDVDVSLQYGQRTGHPDMLTAMISVPLPVQKGSKQDADITAVTADLRAAEAERHVRQNDLQAEIARLHSELERHRAQLALYVKSIVPQGSASLASATSSYQAGRVEFLTVLDNQATLFNYEVEYFRLLSEFATTLAELEQVVGEEVLP